ncbi:MAG: hypothetical protein J6032_00945 [Bacteroidales bacterium]|nr:hypothetical protein [Bacteroidales bacterium]MBP5213167.1 hypothetical protein [Bacteroidales bacterium]
MNKKTIIILSVAGALMLGAIIWLAVSLYDKTDTIDFLTEQYALEKEALADEYSQLAIQYEGYRLVVNNDSLEQKLEDQRIKLQRLAEELRQTKAEDLRKIAALEKELATVRGVLRYYVAQVDSLNQVNEALMAENKAVRQQIRRVSTANENLKQQNEELSQKIDIASHLSANNLKAEAQNKRGKKTSSLKSTTMFVVSFNVGANITAQTGDKDLFVRILKPNEDLLTGAKSGTFSYDGSMIQYSMMKTIEYTGEEQPVTLYWNRNETLDPGRYTFEVFADGKLIGSTSLTMGN